MTTESHTLNDGQELAGVSGYLQSPPKGKILSGSEANWRTSKPHFKSAHVEWGTPPDLREALNHEFRFTLDPCAPGGVWDGREISWANHRVFCNPPYGKGLAKWLSKGREALLAVFLLPARTDTVWFHDYALQSDEIRFFRGRLKFRENHVEPDLDHRNAAPFPSMLVIFRNGAVAPADSGDNMRTEVLRDSNRS